MNDRSSRQWVECKIGAASSQRVMVSKNRPCLCVARRQVFAIRQKKLCIHKTVSIIRGRAKDYIYRLTWIKRRTNIEEVEKTVDIAVTRRLKKRGMSWYKDGANPLLKLRLLRLNGDWDSYWLKIKEDRNFRCLLINLNILTLIIKNVLQLLIYVIFL